MSALAPTDEFRARVLEGRALAESGDFRAAELHFRALLDEARDRHAGNHVLAVQSLITLYGRGGRFLEAHMLARRIAQRARDAGPAADTVLAFALGAECGALSSLELVEPLGAVLEELRAVLDRSTTVRLNMELEFHAAAGVHARGRGEFERAREHLAAYRQLVRDADVEEVFRWALDMAEAQLAHHEGDHRAARELAARFGAGEKTPPFHRLKELALSVGVLGRLGETEAARAAAEEGVAILESVREQEGLASGRIHEGSILGRELERMGALDLAERVYELVAAAVMIRLRQVDECTRELPELGLDDAESAAVLACFRQQFLREQHELLRRVADLLTARGDAYVQRLLERSAPAGMVAICAWCESVRPSDGRWLPLGHFIPREGSLDLTHSICPPCAARETATWSSVP
jgi:hypothetical protein